MPRRPHTTCPLTSSLPHLLHRTYCYCSAYLPTFFYLQTFLPLCPAAGFLHMREKHATYYSMHLTHHKTSAVPLPSVAAFCAGGQISSPWTPVLPAVLSCWARQKAPKQAKTSETITNFATPVHTHTTRICELRWAFALRILPFTHCALLHLPTCDDTLPLPAAFLPTTKTNAYWYFTLLRGRFALHLRDDAWLERRGTTALATARAAL